MAALLYRAPGTPGFRRVADVLALDGPTAQDSGQIVLELAPDESDADLLALVGAPGSWLLEGVIFHGEISASPARSPRRSAPDAPRAAKGRIFTIRLLGDARGERH